MKDEIKEKFYSLEELKRTIDCYDGYLDNEEVYYFIGALRFAYDYITNLQEELKSANESITWYSNRFKAVERDNRKLKEIVENLTTMTVNGDRKQIKNTAQYKLDIYKSRNEKAIRYIERCRDYHRDIHKEERIFLDEITSLLMILNGGDEE